MVKEINKVQKVAPNSRSQHTSAVEKPLQETNNSLVQENKDLHKMSFLSKSKSKSTMKWANDSEILPSCDTLVPVVRICLQQRWRKKKKSTRQETCCICWFQLFPPKWNETDRGESSWFNLHSHIEKGHKVLDFAIFDSDSVASCFSSSTNAADDMDSLEVPDDSSSIISGMSNLISNAKPTPLRKIKNKLKIFTESQRKQWESKINLWKDEV